MNAMKNSDFGHMRNNTIHMPRKFDDFGYFETIIFYMPKIY